MMQQRRQSTHRQNHNHVLDVLHTLVHALVRFASSRHPEVDERTELGFNSKIGRHFSVLLYAEKNTATEGQAARKL